MTAIKPVAALADVQRKNGRSWCDWDYLLAAGCAALLIAPAPVLWVPPVWVLAFMNRPSDETVARPTTISDLPATICARAGAANDNAAPANNEGDAGAVAA